MVCTQYNLLKDGSLANKDTTASGVLLLSAANLASLYDGDLSAPAVTISGTPKFISLEQEFGEAFDVCFVRYYTNEINLSRISISYRNNHDLPQVLSLSIESPGVVRADINDYSRFINIRHTVSGTVANVYELEIYGVRNEELGFGSSPESPIDYYYAEHSTANVTSAAVNEVPLFNDTQFDDYALVSVAPTLTELDRYLFISTTNSGIFYGINDHGYNQPGSNPVILVDDQMLSESLNPQWERRGPAQRHKITPTVEGLIFDLEAENLVEGTSTSETTGLFSKDFFTAQSFTAQIQIRFLSTTNNVFDSAAKDFFFILTNSYPIPDVGYTDSWLTDRRRGGTTIGLAMNPALTVSAPDLDDFILQMRWVDGTATDNPSADSTAEIHEEIEHRWTGGDGSGFFGFSADGEVGRTLGPSLTEYEDIIFAGGNFNDFTAAANWHTWTISYDHRKKEMSAFADHIFLGRRVMRIEAPGESCKLFIGFHGNGGVKWALRNFKILPNVVYRQKEIGGESTVSATVSGSLASRINNGNESSSYVGPNPTSNAHVRIDFPEPKDVTYYSIKQHDQLDSVSAFGTEYFPDVARQAIVDFGGKHLVIHSYTNTSEKLLRAPTYSGSLSTVASGISYLDFQFIEYDRTEEENGALIIDEIEVYAEDRISYPAPPEPTDMDFPWSQGRWNNLRQYGSSNSLAVKYKESILPSFYPIPEYTLEGVDFGFSSAVAGRQGASIANEYHHGGTLFTSPGHTEAGDYRQWHSLNQTDNHIFIWRSFLEMSTVKAIYWNSNTLRPSNVADKFKFQYLSEDGDPNSESDWINIRPISVPHPYTGGNSSADTNYRNYRNYLISHHDGEYYTNYFLMPDYGNGFSVGTAASLIGVPRGLAVPNGYVTNSVRLGVEDNPSTNGLTGYVEFDTPVLTRAIRMVVALVKESGRESGLINGLSGEEGEFRTDFALETFNIFRLEGAGSYTSPVFDTGTRQNTERLSATTKLYEGTSVNMYIRSHPNPPGSSYNTKYEIWESLGRPGNTDVSFSVSINGVSQLDRVITIGSKSYFIRQESVRVYDHDLDLWSSFSPYPSSVSSNAIADDETGETEGAVGTSAAMAPDDSVYNSVSLLGSRLYVASYTTGDNRNPRLMYYDFDDPTTPRWIPFSFNRPPISEDSIMIGDEQRERLYFFNQGGTVSYYDIARNNWVLDEAEFPLLGASLRRGVAAVSFENKVYFFGGRLDNSSNGISSCSVFDLETNQFSSIASSPYVMTDSQAVVVPEERVIYVLPASITDGAGYRTTMKYHIDSDTWEVCESLMWSRDEGVLIGRAGAYYFYHNNYLYRMTVNVGLSRAYVRVDPWLNGNVPDFRDAVWGGRVGASIPWIKVDSFGELMPQERYVQFKAELYSNDKEHSPVLEDITVVIPQEVFVPASGTSNFYLRVGVSPDELYQAWYSAETIATGSESDLAVDDYSILYTKSSDGVTWSIANTVSGTIDDTSDSSFLARRTFSSPWVIKESESSYKIWFTKDYTLANNNAEIYYYTTTDPDHNGVAVLSIAKNAISQSVRGAKQPCVIKESSSSYVIWYTGLDSSNLRRIIRAVSADGITWASHAVSLNKGNISADSAEVYRPCVVKDNGSYRMWYTGVDTSGIHRILHTKSADGISWEVPTISVDISSQGDVDTDGCFNSLVLKDSDSYILYYLGHDGEDNYIVRATSPDGLEWFGFEISIPAGGLVEYIDGADLEDIFVLLNKDVVIPGSMITGAQIKIYNKGAAV